MAESRCKENWAHTSTLLAMTANVNRDVKKKPTPFKPADFNPHAERKKPGIAVTAQNIGILKRVFVDNRRS